MLTIDPKFYARWFGRDDVPEETADRVFRVLEDQLQRRFGSHLQPTPGTTGLLAWRRLQEARQGAVGGEWPTLPPDLQTLIRDTSTQGRFECCPVLDELPNLYCYDMRLAYAACAMALESGREWRHEEQPNQRGDWLGWPEGTGFLGYTPAWYRVCYLPPNDWGHVGLLPKKNDLFEGKWHWPTQGYQWAWASDKEVRLALECGWRVEILERIYAVKPEGMSTYPRPLQLWAERLVEMRREDHSFGIHQDLMWTACRNILLHTIGHFARGARTVKRTIGPGEEVPNHELARETARPFGDGWEFDDYAPSGEDRYLHPEWSALIWADCRTRLLRSRHYAGGEKVTVGALSVPREQVVGFQLDCIYLTQAPAWPPSDKQIAGDYRLKGYVSGPLPAPKDIADLNRLMKGAR